MSWRNASLGAAVRRAAFFPGLLGLFTNPFYFARKGLVHQLCDLGRSVQGRTLDIGCGSKPYRCLLQSTEYVGLETDTPENRAAAVADSFYSGTTLPFEEGSFDSVLTTQVLEHVPDADRFLAEIHRVLRPGGILLLTVPFIWDEHSQPDDFRRYSSFGITATLRGHGFAPIELRRATSGIRVVFQLLNTYLYKRTRSRYVWLSRAATLCFIAPLNIAGELIAQVAPGDPDLYLDNVVLARRMGADE